MQLTPLPVSVDENRVFIEIVDTLEFFAHAERPIDRGAFDFKHSLDLVEHINSIANIAIEFVHEGKNRSVAQSANLHQLNGSFFDALGAVDYHQRRIDCGKDAVCVFRKVLVTRGIEKIDDAVHVRKLHDRRGDRDAALLLHRHPVGCRVLVCLFALNRSSYLNEIAKQNELFGYCGFTSIGVRDDGKRAPFFNFVG